MNINTRSSSLWREKNRNLIKNIELLNRISLNILRLVQPMLKKALGVIISATFKNLVFNYFLNIVREVNMAATYAIEFKKEIIRKYVLSKRDGSFTNLSSFLKVNALSLSDASFYTWRKRYFDEVAEEESLSEPKII